ncbi:hypothetical protein JB92DRAFT_459055 [Gautieria morchelliformis]|nr:hypothetical protein JB92DRAFT_459055 [Gautieria morchelliformis]
MLTRIEESLLGATLSHMRLTNFSSTFASSLRLDVITSPLNLKVCISKIKVNPYSHEGHFDSNRQANCHASILRRLSSTPPGTPIASCEYRELLSLNEAYGRKYFANKQEALLSCRYGELRQIHEWHCLVVGTRCCLEETKEISTCSHAVNNTRTVKFLVKLLNLYKLGMINVTQRYCLNHGFLSRLAYGPRSGFPVCAIDATSVSRIRPIAIPEEGLPGDLREFIRCLISFSKDLSYCTDMDMDTIGSYASPSFENLRI